ncbi:MAG TPA: TolC family protein [Syntrophales bacterium]|nr:TolC family protein [Syntrophales bacterium]
MSRKYVLFLGAAVLFFAGIVGAADQPSVPPQQAGGVRQDAKGTEEAALITLAEGLAIVTSDSHVVKVAKQEENIADSDSKIVRGRLLPNVNASASYTSLANQPASLYLGQAIPLSDRYYKSYGINIQQILFDFQGNLSRYEASRMLFEAQKLTTASVRNAIALEFTIAFYDFLESQRLMEVAAKEVESVASHLTNAESLYNAGVITKNDLLQARVRLSDARQRLLSAKNINSIRASRLNNLLLRPLYRPVVAVEEQRGISKPEALDLESAWKTALDRRPEIQIVDRTIQSLDLESTAKKSEFLPKFFARGSYDYMENAYMTHEDNWSLILGMDINLFEGGSSLADLKKTKYRKSRLIEQRAKLVDEIKIEVQRYLLDLQDAYERILVTRDAAGQAQENLRINKARYEEGVGTATEVLDAVTLLTTAEANYVRSTYDYRKALAATHYAAGEDLLQVYK